MGDRTDPSVLSAGYWGTSERVNISTWGEKRKRERMNSEAGSQVIGLGGSHPHGDKQGGNWRRSALRVLLQDQQKKRWCSSVGRGIRHYGCHPPLLRYTTIADTASHCRDNPPKQRDSAEWSTPQ
ncbi:hypothetical protein P7K49_017448 [Saguinus oedipus]|uniref:Uncharacterized protein n=1 Tax=Saguinus oedipus TaxID=9490 RepID=A0ABQ9V2I7_SAGOE|nr:hypothetical protein P7K49_017448 [Saguinus oedipus]